MVDGCHYDLPFARWSTVSHVKSNYRSRGGSLSSLDVWPFLSLTSRLSLSVCLFSVLFPLGFYMQLHQELVTIFNLKWFTSMNKLDTDM